MADVDILIRLQTIDSSLDSKAQQLERVTASLGLTQELTDARQAAADLEERLHASETRQRQLEWQSDDHRAKLKAIEEKLYSGTVRNPKELTGLQHEVDFLRAQLSGAEDQAIEALGEVDGLRDDLGRARGVEREVEERWRASQVDLAAERDALRGEIDRLRTERASVAATIAAPLLAKYDELRRTRRGLAVARIDRTMCLGCRTSLATSTVQSVRQGKLTTCSSCGRILAASR